MLATETGTASSSLTHSVDPLQCSAPTVGVVRDDFLCRVSGMPASVFVGLRADDTLALLSTIEAIDSHLASQRQELVDALHAAVGAQEVASIRRRLLHLKRCIHNLRGHDDPDWSSLGLDASLLDRLTRFRHDIVRRDELRREVPAHYYREALHVREKVKLLARDDDFQRGLLASSSSLCSQLAVYLGSDSAALSGRQEQIERGILRYLTRAATKATPFGTFCAVLPGSFCEDLPSHTEALWFTGPPHVKRTFVRLNKMLHSVLLAHLIARPAVRRALFVELNPTIESDGTRLRWLMAARQQEIFQRLDPHPVLDVVREVLATRPMISLAALHELLRSDSRFDTDETALYAYLDRLVGIGFLRLCTGFPDQDPDWDVALQRLLETVEDEQATACAALLRGLRALSATYGTASAPDRPQCLAHIHTALTDAFTAMDIKHSLGGKPRLYEDATAPAELKIRRRNAEPALRELVDFVTTVLPAAWARGAQATMRHFFHMHYGHETTVPVLRFYEDYHREHYKEHLAMEGRSARGNANGARTPPDGPGDRAEGNVPPPYSIENPFDLEFIKTLGVAKTRVLQLIRRRCADSPDAESVRLSAAELRDAINLPAQSSTYRSLSCFIQIVPSPDGHLNVVLPQGGFYPGYGKYFSRFLYMLPDGPRQRLLRDNEFFSAGMVAEISGVSSFNANLHPRLMRWEISYPTTDSGNTLNPILCTDIDVAVDPADPHALRLQHRPTGRQIIPVDLGFMNPQLRPALFRLLAHFTPASGFALPLPFPQPLGARQGAHRDRIGYRPRLVFGEHVVVSRRCWAIPDSLFPRWAPGTDRVDHFATVDHWRRQWRIPAQAFVRIVPVPDHVQQKGTDTARVGRQATRIRDFRKPQFVDFGNPLLVTLFGRMPGDCGHFTALVEECLPAESERLKYDGTAFATECVLQIDYPESATVDARGRN